MAECNQSRVIPVIYACCDTLNINRGSKEILTDLTPHMEHNA